MHAEYSTQRIYETAAVRYFDLLAIAVAVLVGVGKQSASPPLLIIIAVLASWLLTDRLGWVRLNRLSGYVGMLIGAGLALSGFWFQRTNQAFQGAANLDAVSNMLIYIQIPLMFQRKDKRLFEHWGVFLLLEIVVAALLGDNAFFGLLLIPTLILSCLTLLFLAAYVTHVELETGPSSTFFPVLSGWWAERQSQYKVKRKLIDLNPSLHVESHPLSYSSPRFFAVICLGGIGLFSLAYFFGLPRLHTGAYEGLGISRPMVGFSGTVRLEDVGRLMMNNELALRVFIRDADTDQPYVPIDPPYLRGVVADIYEGHGQWKTRDIDGNFAPTLRLEALRPEAERLGDRTIVTIHEQAGLEAAQFSFPPFLQDERVGRLYYNPSSWCLLNDPFSNAELPKRPRYRFETRAFLSTRQLPWLVEAHELTPSFRSEENGDRFGRRYGRQPSHLVDYGNEVDFSGLIAWRESVLANSTDMSLLDQILTLEETLATSPAFRYSLEPQVDYRNGLDPIEDFVVNHRTGHCQFFASALAIAVRTMGIPSRLVIGFRPSEYNDVGNFFAVRQRHAHVWTEVFLNQKHFRDTVFELPDWIEGGVWLRLDPTPAGEGSNSGGSYRQGSSTGQAFESFEQLWQEGFMEFDSTRQPAALGWFGAGVDGPIAFALRSIEGFYLQLQTQNIENISLTSEHWISWRAGLLAAIVALVVAALGTRRWRETFLSNCNRFFHRFSWASRSRHTTSVLFFQRILRALSRMGWERRQDQTPLEFAVQVQPWLDENCREYATVHPPLKDLVEKYYAVRFGSTSIDPLATTSQLETSVRALEAVAKRTRGTAKSAG